jgi:hypothetical protein
MNRRNFVAGITRSGLALAAVSAASATAARGREFVDRSADEVGAGVEALRKRMDALEDHQKNYLRALCVITAVSTGVDLSILL